MRSTIDQGFNSEPPNSLQPTRSTLKSANRLSKDWGPLHIAHQLDCDISFVSLLVRSRSSAVGVADPWTPRAGRLSVDEREQILVGLAQGESLSAIARSLRRSPSTVSREVKANGGPKSYSVLTTIPEIPYSRSLKFPT